MEDKHGEGNRLESHFHEAHKDERMNRILNEKENKIPSGKRVKRKTTYFFEPQDTLNPNTTNKKNKVENKLYNTSSKSQAWGGRNENQGQEEVPIQTPIKSSKALKRKKFILENQSSDDSFDGIKWRRSPGTASKDMNLLSSPLGETENSNHVLQCQEETKHSSVYINEQADSVLSKYGSGLNNISLHTPSLYRSQSDVVSSNREAIGQRNHHSVSPLLPRSKTLISDIKGQTIGEPELHAFKNKNNTVNNGYRSLSRSDSKISTWLDRFDFSSKHSGDTKEGTPEIEIETDNPEWIQKDSREPEFKSEEKPCKASIDNTAHPIIATEQTLGAAVQGIDFSDDFSDSGVASSPKLQENKLDSEDPFSSDDEFSLSIIKAQEDKNITEKQGNVVKTSEPNTQKRSDLLHAEVFLGDIARIEGDQNRAYYDTPKETARISFERSDLKRYKINEIFTSSYILGGRNKSQLILSVVNSRGDVSDITVRGEYLQLEFQKEDIIHIIITDESCPHLVDDEHNLLIWNPDVLISSTTVSQQMSCPRKSVLQERFNFPGESSIPLIVGVVLHEVFQTCFMEERYDLNFMISVVDNEIHHRRLEIFSCGDKIKEVKDQILPHLKYIDNWFKLYFTSNGEKKGHETLGNRGTRSSLYARRALDIEENIWSPMFGLKGKVDVSLEGEVNSKTKQGTYLLPMEIKTGREYLGHHAQASLYSLLFKDRYNVDVSQFLLVYTKEMMSKLCDISPNDLRSLVNLRNRVSKHLRPYTRSLPPVIKQSQCDRCDLLNECMSIHTLVEDGFAEESGINEETYELITSHIEDNEDYKEFYNYWDNLITQEEGVLMSLKKDLWVLTAEEREKSSGRALFNMKIRSFDSNEARSEFLYTFERSTSDMQMSLQNSQISKFDRIIVSDENGHFALAQGYVIAIRPTFIKLALNRKVSCSTSQLKHFNPNNNQVFESVLSPTQDKSIRKDISFRIDKDDMFHGMGLARYNILNLFLHTTNPLMRNMLVELKEPKFSPSKNTSCLPYMLNKEQKAAIEKILQAHHYALILGMPGTGKTTLIASLIDILIKQGKTILLASYTHSAVDNILLKLEDYTNSILRVGSFSRVHKDIKKYIPGWNTDIKTYQDFCEVYHKPQVVATTCLGINDITFNLRTHFDYCIIDEASQVSMPISLGPLRFCDKFILVGDHNQLPPLVQNPKPEIRKGLSRSLFKILSESHPESIIELSAQYRMCSDIMLLSNVLVYDGRLKCGSADVANKSLMIPFRENVQNYINDEFEAQVSKNDLWLNEILEENHKVLFLDHDSVPARERVIGNKIENVTEAELIRQIVECLIACGVKESQVGVMSLYRSQLRLLHRKLTDRTDVEILTADQFQGRDKDCIIISLVRSNTQQKVGDLLKEWRRVNVAITRSKSKLIILGSKTTLDSLKMLEAFLGVIESRNWIYRLPPNADKIYNFPTSDVKTTQKGPKINKNLHLDSKLISENFILNDIVNDIVK
ncbi:Piso0_000959 [Millerozyma farinosa CBS 7064]|uniref:DNA replication ATP-dependent helicase/nuclease n=1 Tax=Pichia sorbitophila (strain ATCC MYA-4447 / BCRC 22081 / CBS 7064 / NBRC 10061 / NRRL Y-12695) TaxID=559304 RepID=G8YQI9_PICSO|nr:Piso0_000959 [Millerozyma farinosa CBS 7064]CCE78924.1 Piso0_000959 [Millerozyma farinosa CBS 7064]